MHCTLTIVRYPKWLGWAGFLSMALFRIPLLFNKNVRFWKLMGCGKNGSFDANPDWRQWATLVVGSRELGVGSEEGINFSHPTLPPYSLLPTPNSLLSSSNSLLPTPNSLLTVWWRFFRCEVWSLVLEPIEGHGTWDGKAVFGDLPRQTEYEGLIGVLTRATIRWSALKRFWSQVDGVAKEMRDAEGLVHSVGIGEVPWIKQATFSLWESKAQMKAFAYRTMQHKDVMRRTHTENWYSEEMFVRFRPIASYGSINGKNPLERML